MLELVSLPFCTAVLVEAWDAPPGRHYVAYRARGDFRWILGHAVVDEFATLSSPVFLTPRPLLGKIYNAGLSLGHRRDRQMGLDLGWPPFCVGLELAAPSLPRDWEHQLLEALTEPLPIERQPPAGVIVRHGRVGRWKLASVRQADATVLAISAPLLPRQLHRLCEAVDTPVTVAVATGNRVERAKGGRAQAVRAVSEARLASVLAAARGLWP